MTEPRRFFLRTFGCQMNEHDSERIAGLLQADGLVETGSAEDADVVVLNTCCIRENADNKLYGTLGHLKSVKDRKPGMQIMVAGCLAQKDRDTVTTKAPYVDVVLGTHNVHRAADLLHEATEAGHSIVEILEETVAEDLDAFPSALPVRREVPWAGWVTIQKVRSHSLCPRAALYFTLLYCTLLYRTLHYFTLLHCILLFTTSFLPPLH